MHWTRRSVGAVEAHDGRACIAAVFSSCRGVILRVVAGAALVAVSVGSLGTSADAAQVPRAFVAQPSTSANWAGYVATGPGSTGATASPAMSYTDVTGQWVVPTATCSGSHTSVAIWVGLGGFSVGSQSLEQAGIAADCSTGGKPRYYAWYELVPANAVTIALTIEPGDVITSSVVSVGGGILVQVIDRTHDTRFTKRVAMSGPDLSSAEWIAEAPAACLSSGACRQLPLTHFGSVTFTRTYATGNGIAGTITSPNWTATAIQLIPAPSHRAYGRSDVTSATTTGSGAMPVGLGADGSGFTVEWEWNPGAAA
jgi:hypothetical protein